MTEPKAFAEAYAKLNAAQKKAVDTVEGPVLVIAGPGTGKTHILTLRIANILAKTQATPDSILVLTFTDSAARNVSRRLSALIGDEAARKVGAFTFHSFAEYIMKEYPAAFAEYSNRRLMGEVEQVLLWRDILMNRDVKFLRTPKAPFHYLNDLKSLEDDLTRECVSLDEYRTWLDQKEKEYESDEDLRYKRGSKDGSAAAGELNDTGKRKFAGIEKGREAITLIEAYREEKEARGLYGYTDVLAIAVETLKTDESLRADLQERYQYVLADEHQDANALQHGLLDALAFDDHPNLFIVGDEKQAIFGFQGADVTHFRTFLKLYPRTEVIALTENFRSYQGILDLSHTLLKDLPSAAGEHVQLSAARGAGGTMKLLQSPDPLAELSQVAELVEAAIASGTRPEEIAVIVAKNDTANLFAAALRAKGIPTLRAGNIDLEGRPFIRYLLAFMHVACNPGDTVHLRELMLAPWWEDPIEERIRIMRTANDKELWLAMANNFPEILSPLQDLARESRVIPPMSFISDLLNGAVRDFLLSHPETVAEDIPLVRQLIMHFTELASRNPNATFPDLLEQFSYAREHDIGNIKSSVTQREGFVTVITVHKAKGMEFEKVFAASLTASEWESRGKSALIPSPFDSARDKEEIVRLFYVALTRAKNELVLSYPVANAEGKETKPMSLLPGGLETIDAPIDPLPSLHATYDAPALIRELTLNYLTRDGLSPSAFNEYLDSPPTFFARRVLRLREPETRAIAVGNAVHAGIAAYLRSTKEETTAREQAATSALYVSLARSLLPRGDAFDQLTAHARACLDAYMGSNTVSETPTVIEEEFKVTRTIDGHDIILKGKVDAVLAGETGECIVDFKTSTTIEKKDQAKFERQLAFYDLLLRENEHPTTSALILQVGEDAVKGYPVALTDATREELASTLDDVLNELISGKWRNGERATPDANTYDALLELLV